MLVLSISDKENVTSNVILYIKVQVKKYDFFQFSVNFIYHDKKFFKSFRILKPQYLKEHHLLINILINIFFLILKKNVTQYIKIIFYMFVKRTSKLKSLLNKKFDLVGQEDLAEIYETLYINEKGDLNYYVEMTGRKSGVFFFFNS